MDNIKQVAIRKVCCDGGNESLGHPKVYLEIGPENVINCPYCGRQFIYSKDA